MSVQLSRTTVQKLTHESTEIRLRTLEQVEAKLMRALAHNEIIDFKPGELCKQLIRWFGYQPLQAPIKALQLMARLLRSQYADEAVEHLGMERFIREMGKVKLLLRGRSEELQVVEEIQQLLRQHKNPSEEVIEILDSLSLSDVESVQHHVQESITGERIKCPPSGYEAPWSKPSIADFNTMQFVGDVLVNPFASCVELQNSLQHLQITMADYPAEYMLQAPHIFLNLLHLYEKAAEINCPLEDVAATFLVFLQCLKTRLQLRRKVLYFVTPLKDALVLGKTQLKVEKALQLLMQHSLKQLKEIICEFRSEISHILEILLAALDIYKMQHWCVDRACLQQLYDMSVRLKDCCEQDEHFTLQRIKFILLSLLLQDMAENNASRQPFLDTQYLAPLLQDYTFKLNFPQRRKELKNLVCAADTTLMQREEMVEKYQIAFGTTMQVLKNPQSLKCTEILAQSASICLTLDTLMSMELVKILFDAIKSCNAHYATDEILRTQADTLLGQLLQVKHEPLKAFAYSKLAQAVKKHFGCLMQGEGYCTGLANEKLLAAHIIGVPLSTPLLVRIIHESYESIDATVRQHCEDVLTLLLKSQYLMGPHWTTFLDILLPVLPLLQCCTATGKIVKLLMKLYDPDARNLPFASVLQGNTCFLFHPDVQIRCEALTRLIYMLNSLDNAGEYVPNIMEISDLLPSDLCILQAPREFARIFAGSEVFNEPATLHNLLALLETPDIEPLIRKTTLLQLNVMCQSWELTAAFCQASAYYLIMQALENAMQQASYADYTDAIIPAISILTKVMLYDATLRQELCQMPNIYVLLLRALFLYQQNIQVRQDASICIWLLIYACYVVVLPGHSSVQVPCILANLQLPLKCELTRFLQFEGQHKAELTAIFASVNDESLYLRHLLATSYVGCHTKINHKSLTQLKQLDFCSELQYTQRDLRLLKATIPAQNLGRFLRTISNATAHHTLVNAIITVKLQLLVQQFDLVPALPVDISEEMFKLLGRYLQQPPGNEADFLLFEQLLDFAIICIRMPLPAFITALASTLQADFQHACLTLLKNAEIPLRLYCKMCQMLTFLFSAEESTLEANTKTDPSIFFSNLFELLFKVAYELFEQRDLQRVRCLLTLLQVLSTHELNMSDRELHYYCKRCLQLSIALKSFTQTGAQWQRDCLLLNCQLYTQMSHPQEIYNFNASLLKYLSGLCGHNDAQVRALAWCILAQVASFKGIAGESTGAKALLTELVYLPGGFMACCLSTLLDNTEVVLVRQLAGQLFVDLLSNFEDGLMLLEQHAFVRSAQSALNTCLFEELLPRYFDYAGTTDMISCELVSCFSRICIKMVHLRADYLVELCEKAFMFKLYDLLKAPPAHDNPAYYSMCADICQLYALCYDQSFVFLQRTLCRDHVWLMCFYQLLDQPNAQESELFNILQLLLALAKDDNAYAKLCEMFDKAPEFIVKLCRRACNVPHLATNLQRCTLAVLTLLLLKSQHSRETVQKSFAEVLEGIVEIDCKESLAEKNAFQTKKLAKRLRSPQNLQDMKPIYINAEDITKRSNKEQIAQAQQNSSQPLIVLSCYANDNQHDAVNTNPAAVFIFMDLFRLFTHLYTLQSCKFDSAPSSNKVQLCETIAVLLKFSPSAQKTAKDLKFFNKIVSIFKSFLEEFNTSCTTFVRRYGETRKMAIIKNFQLLLNILLNWYATPTAVLTDELQALNLSKVLIQIWPWLAHSGDLKLIVLQLCAFLSEHSLIVCQQFSVLICSYANSILQLILKIASFETTKVKALSSENFPVIATAMRVLMNCCACAEGRVSLVKAHALDIFDGLHPFNLKSPKIKLELLHSWLQFWELFSRYAAGATVRNLNSLCAVINRSPACCITRLLSLKILRNMCFLPSNRTTLMASTDFIYTVNEIISQQPVDADSSTTFYSFEEQLAVCVAIWKLLSGGAKFVAMLRGTKLAKQFRMLREQLTSLEEADASTMKQLPFARDLTNVLDVILIIFNNS